MVLAIVAALALIVRIQPAGSARIVRDGDALRVVANRIGFVPPGGTPCIASFANGLGRFDRVVEAEDSGGETIPVAIRFDYAVPDRVPAAWPAGDWCASLSSRVEQIAKTWIAHTEVEALRRDPRRAGEGAPRHWRRNWPRCIAVADGPPAVPESAMATLRFRRSRHKRPTRDR